MNSNCKTPHPLRALRAGLISLLFALAATGFSPGLQAQDQSKPSAAGSWKWVFSTPNGDQFDLGLKLKQEGEKLTGTYSGRGRDSEIQDGVFRDGQISFRVLRERDGQTFTLKYAGKLDGDKIHGKVEADFGGEARSFDWEAKRAAPPASASGNWVWAFTTPNGDKIDARLKLQQEGEKLTGTLFARGNETPILEGRLVNGEISFNAVRERDGRKIVTQYKGRFENDRINGKSETEVGGEIRTREWDAKREREGAVPPPSTTSASSAAGEWKWSFTTGGGQTIDATLKLEQDGEKLSGVYIGRSVESKIEDGKIKDGELSFTVRRERDGQTFVARYSGKVERDIIKGRVETDIGGQARTRDWEAKRTRK